MRFCPELHERSSSPCLRTCSSCCNQQFLFTIYIIALQRAQHTVTAMVVMCEVACTACYQRTCLFEILECFKGFLLVYHMPKSPNLTITHPTFIIGMVGCSNSDCTPSCTMLSWVMYVELQAKQEEEQQKAQEDAKKRQEAIRKRDEEAAQRRFVTVCQQV